jgi:hypothetical protein
MQRHITHCGPLRYTMIHQTPDQNYFIHPLALRKLALFLVEYVNVPAPDSPPPLSLLLTPLWHGLWGRVVA